MAHLEGNNPLPPPVHPSRALADLLCSPQPNTPSHLLDLSHTALNDLNATYSRLKSTYAEAQSRYLSARQNFNGWLAEFNRWKIAPEDIVKAVGEARKGCERAEREMGVNKGAMERCERESGVLNGDVSVPALLQCYCC